MSRLTYLAVLEPSADGYGVYFPDLPGCISFGKDIEDAKKMAREALELHIYGMEKDGDIIPEPSLYLKEAVENGIITAITIFPDLVKNVMDDKFYVATVNVAIQMDEELKKQAEELFASLGYTMESAIIAFAMQVVKEQRIPFALDLNVPNAETIGAIEEIEEMKRNPESYEGYADVDEMMTELEDIFDLKVFEEYEADPDKKTYTLEEVKNILDID